MVLLATLVLAACSDGPEGASLTVTVVGEPGGLARRLEAEATRPTLVGRDGGGAIVTGLASGWRFVDDGHGLIMRLAPVKWSDGKPLIARDVVAAFTAAARRREPALAMTGLSDGGGRVRARAPIDRVVELSLTQPSPWLLEWLAEPELAVVLPGRRGLAAYRAEAVAGGRRLIRRFAEARPAARPAAVTVQETGDAVAAITAFRQGRSDIVIGDGLAGLGDARTTAPGQALRLDPLWGVYGLRFNPRRRSLADAGVRRALLQLADRSAAAGQFGVAALVATDRLLPPGLVGRSPSPPEPLVPAARLATAGIAPETPLRITIVIPPGRDHQRAVAAAVAPWQAQGVSVRIIVADAARRRRLANSDAWDLMVDDRVSAVPDAVALLDRWTCRHRGFCNADADAMWAAAAASPDPARRAALAAKAEALWLAEPPLVPLFGAVRWALVAPRVDGWLPNRAGAHPLARLAISGR